MGCGERSLGGVDGEIGRHLAVRGDVTLADAGALHDPFVGGVDGRGEVRVAEGALRQIAAAAEHDGTCHGHEAASWACRTRVSRILLSNP